MEQMTTTTRSELQNPPHHLISFLSLSQGATNREKKKGMKKRAAATTTAAEMYGFQNFAPAWKYRNGL